MKKNLCMAAQHRGFIAIGLAIRQSFQASDNRMPFQSVALVVSLKICYLANYYLFSTLMICLQRSLAANAKWSENWDLNFNCAKTEQLFVGDTPIPLTNAFSSPNSQNI